MEEVLKGLRELKGHVAMLRKDNDDNRAHIAVLEIGLSEKEDRIKDLEENLKAAHSENGDNKAKLALHETWMSEKEDRIKDLVDDMKKVLSENADNKAKIAALKRKLSEKEGRIKRLEDDMEKAHSEIANNEARIVVLETQLTEKGGSTKDTRDAKSDKGFQALEKKVAKLELQQQQQIQDTNDRFRKLDTLHVILSGAILKNATGLDKHGQTSQDQQSSQDQAASALSPEDAQDLFAVQSESRLQKEFNLNMQRVQDHKVPLNSKEYRRLSALELIAGIPNGPALKASTYCYGGDQNWAEKERRDEIQKLRGQGISTASEAMTEYNKLCCYPSHCPAETRFYVVGMESFGFCILVIEPTHLRVLEETTKMEEESWQWTQIRSCRLDAFGGVGLEFQDGGIKRIRPLDSSNRELCQTIRTMLKR